MRALTLVSLAAVILVCLPSASAIGPVPTVSITIDQASETVNATNHNQTVKFTGSVTVTKSAYLSATVTLEATATSGCSATLDPVSMTFTSTTPQTFNCYFVVPGGTPGGNESTLTVSGTVVSGMLQGTDEATAVIKVVGTLPAQPNQSQPGTNTTKPSNGGNSTYIPSGLVSNRLSNGILGYTYEQWGYISAGAVIAILALVAVVRIRRRRNAVYNVDEAADDR